MNSTEMVYNILVESRYLTHILLLAVIIYTIGRVVASILDNRTIRMIYKIKGQEEHETLIKRIKKILRRKKNDEYDESILGVALDE